MITKINEQDFQTKVVKDAVSLTTAPWQQASVSVPFPPC